MVRGAAIRLQAHTVRPKAHDTNGLCVNAVKTAKKYLKRLAKTDDQIYVYKLYQSLQE